MENTGTGVGGGAVRLEGGGVIFQFRTSSSGLTLASESVKIKGPSVSR